MKHLIYISFLLLFVSCYNKNKPKKPDNLIAKDKMVTVLVDMSLYNSAKGVNKKVIENSGVKLQEQIYAKHEIDSAQFANSNYYYTYNTELYNEIYKQVKDSLTKLKNKYKAIDVVESKQKKVQDSIKRSKLKSVTTKNYLNKPLKAAVSKKD
ncbi:DUF4296 domain-containing protein [Lacinutrix sp. C3R15]|uniref:DUF4296 domain-containing protein n=1 Tax=Flavobacteriaceae TaxID=49546 RepID=UPI001C08558D|nr:MULTISPECIES: DUF4296 domain-containing protein [Flavobacteriaceae]MBU2939048.1 DUF4296 domain-containing protein [Lacinutrix sp. C3R15]MDO6622363.1 DUF4296 domain-containing protein [Oceanihabitans sp. 1_MG-2023]